jgi:hypothetical protein
MKIYVKTSGGTATLSAEPNTTIDSLTQKLKVNNEAGYLIFGGRMLLNGGATLQQCGISGMETATLWFWTRT